MERGKAQVVHHLLNQLGVAEVSDLFGLPMEDVGRIAAQGNREITTIQRTVGIDVRPGPG